VVYDSKQTDVGQIETWLKESGTYIRTVPDTRHDEKSTNQ
jgi:hypothetical protein